MDLHNTLFVVINNRVSNERQPFFAAPPIPPQLASFFVPLPMSLYAKPVREGLTPRFKRRKGEKSLRHFIIKIISTFCKASLMVLSLICIALTLLV